MPSKLFSFLTLILTGLGFQLGQLLSVITQTQFYVLNEGDSLSLECSFRSDHYTLFDYPVIWRKRQMTEETQMNVMGSLNEPFVSSNRFEVTFTALAPVYLVELSILDLKREDSGNYTCEIRGPQSLILGKVAHHVFIRAPVERIIVLNENFSVDEELQNAVSILHLVENHPSNIRCLSYGGYPPPSLEVYIGNSDVTSDFLFRHDASLVGTTGLRTMTYRTERMTGNYLPKAGDNESLLKCVASVPGLKPVVERVKLDVDFSPKITCKSEDAFIGQTNVDLSCEVIAKPPLTAIFWIIDSNGTTLTEGMDTNEFRSSKKQNIDGSFSSHLYINQVRPENFRPYTIVVENKVTITARDVDLYQKAKAAAAARPLAVSVNSHVASDSAKGHRSHGYVLVQHGGTIGLWHFVRQGAISVAIASFVLIEKL